MAGAYHVNYYPFNSEDQWRLHFNFDWFTFISNKNDYNNKIKISELRNKNEDIMIVITFDHES